MFGGAKKKEAVPAGTGNIGGMMSAMGGGSATKPKAFSKNKIKRYLAKANGVPSSSFSIEDYNVADTGTTFRVQMKNGQSMNCSIATGAASIGDANCS